MSNILNRFTTDKCTIWHKIGEPDIYGNTLYADPVIVQCCYLQGGKIAVGADGKEFQPASTYSMKYALCQRGDKIALGELAGAPDENQGVEEMRKVATGTPLRGSRDYLVLTG